MTEALASRVAGLKLGGIVSVLMLPMLVLSYLMVSSLREDIDFTKRELVGIQLNRLVIPVAISAAQGKIDDDAVLALRNQGRDLARELGVTNQFNGALASLLTYGSDTRFSVKALSDLQTASATASNIILDPFAESYFLGSLLSRDVPEVLADYMTVSTLASNSLRDHHVTWNEVGSLLISTGAWSESQKRLVDNLVFAHQASPGTQDYNNVKEVANEMADHPEHLARILTSPASSALASQLSTASELGSESSHIIGDLSEVWAFSLSRFDGLLNDRLSSMLLRLYSFLSIAAVACIIGVGGAALMFRSTLKQLDIVKQASDESNAARVEAEQAASEVQRINEEIVKLNSDLARNLEMLREAQEESLRKGKMAQLGQLTATVAHELRNPLGAVRTSVFLLEKKIKGKGLGVEPQIERINNGVTRCDNIISQLLDFARSKALQLETTAFDDWLAKIVEEEAQALPAAVAIECRLGLGNLAVAFDPARMGRAIINLIANASEATVGKGDDASRFATSSPVITISTALSQRGVEVTVADNGPGIPSELLAKIFEPLFTTKNFGTGLGLPAVQKIMEQHGGNIDVSSSPGQGARFTAWWPVDKRSEAAA